MHPWLNTNLYPFKLNSIEIEGDKLSYIDEGKGDVIIFIHGNFEWSLCWKQVIQNLKSQYRCIAFDQLGFGLSEKPRHADYSFQASTRRLELLIDKLGLRSVTLVSHLSGGIITMNYAVAFPEVVRNVIMLNAGIKFLGNDAESKSKYKKLLGKYRKVFAFNTLGFIDEYLPDIKDKKDVYSQYQQVYKDKNALASAINYVDQLMNGEFWYNGFRLRIGRLKNKPVSLIRLHSSSNNMVSDDEEWKKALPGMRILTIEGQKDLYNSDSSIISEAISGLMLPNTEKTEITPTVNKPLEPLAKSSLVIAAPEEEIKLVDQENKEEFAEESIPEVFEVEETKEKSGTPMKSGGRSTKKSLEPKPSASSGKPQLDLDF